MRFERTRDYQVVYDIITHPDVYPYMVSDGAESLGSFQISQAESNWYVLVYSADELLGMFFIVPYTAVLAEVHTCFLPGPGRKLAVRAYREGLKWLGVHSKFKKVIGFIPEDNPRALVVALRGGLEIVGVLTKSISKNGKLLDQTIVAREV